MSERESERESQLVRSGLCLINYVQSSRFSIVKGNGEKQLSVYVIHSLPTLMSVVQLWDKGEMVMVCHLVSADTVGYEKALGLDNQVCSTGCLITS